MNIVSPVVGVEETGLVIDAGVDEIYCGVLTGEQKRRYTNLNCFNRRPVIGVNLSSFFRFRFKVFFLNE